MTDTRLAVLENGFAMGGWVSRAISATAVPPLVAAVERDRFWMTQALWVAMEAVGRSSPNPAVGAIIVQGNHCVSRGATAEYGSFHAEKVALLGAPESALKGAECYVTLEPCGGLGGKQGPCATALIEAGVRRVIIAAKDPHPKAAGLGVSQLRNAGIEVVEGCMAGEASAWHFPFLAFQHKKAPILIGKWAQTLDGHLADDFNRSQWISGSRSRAYTHWLRQKYDAIMIGVQTLLADQPRLTARDAPPPHARHPHKIIFDPSGRLATAAPEALSALFDGTAARGPLVYWGTRTALGNLPPSLASYADRLVTIPVSTTLQWPEFFASLNAAHQARFSRELQSIMVEGGSQLLTLLIRADQIDACHIFLRTGLLGGVKNRIGRLDKGENPSVSLMDRHDYKLLTTQSIDDDVLIECVHRKYAFWRDSTSL